MNKLKVSPIRLAMSNFKMELNSQWDQAIGLHLFQQFQTFPEYVAMEVVSALMCSCLFNLKLLDTEAKTNIIKSLFEHMM